jgi:hypothetical protein
MGNEKVPLVQVQMMLGNLAHKKITAGCRD